MNKAKQGISIHIERSSASGQKSGILFDGICAALLTVSFWLMLYFGLGLGNASESWLTGGLPVLADCFADRLTFLTLKIHTGVSSGSPVNAVFTPVMILLTAVLAYLAFRVRNILILVFFALIGIAGAVTGVLPLNLWTIVYFAVLVMAFVYKAYRSGACRKHLKNAAVLALLTAVCGVALWFLLSLAFSGTQPDFAQLREQGETWMHKKNYETDANPMPEGKVSKAGSFEAGTETALEVSETAWETTYLKGFVGEDYDGSSWVRIRDEGVVQDADLFYWLHKNGFYAQTQTGAAYSAAGSEANSFVSVTNHRACRNYCYLPYGVSAEDSSFLDADAIGDLNIQTTEPALSEDNIYPVTSGAADESRVLQKELRTKDDGTDDAVSRYLDQEEAYRNYCKRRYLSIPEDVKKAIEGCLGEQKELQPAEAMETILAYMNKSLRYSEKSAAAGNEDFIVKFLTKTEKGYAIHYASAAVMMLRYFGIPARYAEGFIVPDTLYLDVPEMGTVDVTMRYSHAWAEYYLDGVGWLPFETVPKYQRSGKGGAGTNANSGKKTQETSKQNQEETDNPMNRHGYIFVPNLALIFGCLGFLVLLLLVWLLLRRIRFRRFLKTFEGPDCRLASGNAFAYAITLLKASGMNVNATLLREALALPELSDEARQQMEQCISVNEALRYGKGEAGEEERRLFLDFKNTCLRIYKERSKWTKKLKDRLILCIY